LAGSHGALDRQAPSLKRDLEDNKAGDMFAFNGG